MLLAEVIALTVDFIPFTRAYQPGHAKLKTLWWLYILGIYVFAYWPLGWSYGSWILPRPCSKWWEALSWESPRSNWQDEEER